jgi:hypothetical protein
VLVEIENGPCRGLGQLQHPRNVGTALATNFGDLPPPFEPQLDDRRHLQQLLDRRATGGAVRPAVFDLLAGFRPVDQPRRAFDEMVVGAEEIRHFGGVARAAQVLKQQGIELCGTVACGQAQFFGQPHADQRRAHAVPLRMSLRDIERDGERRNDF